ncbi:SDR family oxidoreductase [Aurantimonas marianensis]|uniref:SDR family oxidoreductase n=1 Tax=Aurantimonas marianensis TaxID=2920428 RepID=A0A9X2KEU1_9HYPH|nr:SDR family oxidoreductase [Aurantimonas marianensis]MCP3054640.1 SDR family oxidoreductase [Aurantimonas marianensis]
MDLGLTGKFAIVCASSRGLGRGCATELARAGCTVVLNGRDEEVLRATAEAIAGETGAEIIPVVADVATAEGQARLVGAVPQVDILVNNNGGPPLRDFRALGRDDLMAGVTGNMIAPIEMVQRVIDGMVERRFGRIVNITSSSVKGPIAGLDLSSGARAGLTGFLAGVARTVAGRNVTINCLLPGAFDTDRLRSNFEAAQKRESRSLDEIRADRAAGIPAGRFGEPDEFGKACAFLCSARSGYITGQSLLIDGGAFPGVF